MKTTLLKASQYKRNEIGPANHRLISLLFVLFSIICTSGFAQKVVDQQELQGKLDVVNENIQKIDEATATINLRIAGIPPENLDPSIQVRLNDLQLLKDQYTREKVSIEAALSSAQNSVPPNSVEDTIDSTFNTPKTH